MKNIMLDLETMGNTTTAAIVSIGACYFDYKEIGKTFYAKIKLQSAMKYGTIDADTILWWLQQKEDARKEIYNQENAVLLTDALKKFQDFCNPDILVWGNGADFDNAILTNAYKKTGLKVPWEYGDNRCFRTLKRLFKDTPKPPYPDDAHNALSDAIYQAKYAMPILGAIEGAD